MTPDDCLQMYVAIKLHFTSKSYDYFKYSGKLKYPPDFRKRKDKQFFSWLSRKPEAKELIISNLAAEPQLWIGNILQDKAKDVYTEWKKRQESLSYVFKNELDKLVDNFPNAFKVIDGQHPEALKLYMQKEVSLETLTILNDLLGFLSNWDKGMGKDPTWLSLRLPLMKYRPFMTFDKEKYRQIFIDTLKEKA